MAASRSIDPEKLVLAERRRPAFGAGRSRSFPRQSARLRTHDVDGPMDASDAVRP